MTVSAQGGAKVTIGSRMDRADGRPAGFDYMRLILSVLVIASHTPQVTWGTGYAEVVWASPLRTPLRLVLPMFFCLSGFLVAGSFERSRTLGLFMGLRVIRIFPALVVEVILSALILGPLLTAYPLSDYLSDPLFARYFINMLGDPQYQLPGVFMHNPFPDLVNPQLWTVPFELFCYLSLALAALIGARRRPVLVPILAVTMTLGYGVVRYFRNGGFQELSRPMPGPLLVICFLVGVTIYLYRHRLPANHGTGAAIAVASIVCLATPTYPQFVAPWPIAYLTAYIGTLNPRRNALVAGADYSYGIYLYGFPLQQTVASFGAATQSVIVNFVCSVLGAASFAAFSWHLIERPSLALRGPLRALEDRWLAWRGRMPRMSPPIREPASALDRSER